MGFTQRARRSAEAAEGEACAADMLLRVPARGCGQGSLGLSEVSM